MSSENITFVASSIHFSFKRPTYSLVRRTKWGYHRNIVFSFSCPRSKTVSLALVLPTMLLEGMLAVANFQFWAPALSALLAAGPPLLLSTLSALPYLYVSPASGSLFSFQSVPKHHTNILLRYCRKLLLKIPPHTWKRPASIYLYVSVSWSRARLPYTIVRGFNTTASNNNRVISKANNTGFETRLYALDTILLLQAEFHFCSSVFHFSVQKVLKLPFDR